MPGWGDLLEHFGALSAEAKAPWLVSETHAYMNKVSALRGNRNVLLYGSAWLQKPQTSGVYTQITHEDINGFMSSIQGMDVGKGLTLLIHTPGGVINAAETIASYLHSKFAYIETVIPVYAMSAGTMIALGTNKIIMGRQSQLGPIDPQLPLGNRLVSARSIVDQFRRAQTEIMNDQKSAHVWAPILQTIGPSLLNEAENSLAYGEKMVASWLAKGMFAKSENPEAKAASVAAFFNDAAEHKSHGRRIDRDEVRSKGIDVADLEENQDLQDAVLSLYHLMTLINENTPASKLIMTSHGKSWIKNLSQAPAGP